MQFALPLYALTLFISAFILFLVQPIVGKIILPKLGGTPQVWNTCMVFFQMVLLAGYAYTHNVSTRLTLRQQLIAHGVLLCLPLIVLLPFPFALGGQYLADGETINPSSLWGFLPDLGSNPIPSTLAVLFTYVALPFLVVSTSAPLLQKWFVHTGHPAAKDPYFLYGASNLGSMLSLIVYPLAIEPYFRLSDQGWIYAYGYLSLMAFVLVCATMVWTSKDMSAKLKHEPHPEPAPAPTPPVTPAEAQTGITTSAPAPSPAAAASTAMKPGQPAKHGQPKHAAGKPHGPVEHAGPPGSDELTFGRRFRWVMLAAVPSSLMLGITTHITTDLSPIPLFWLVPLILYLLSFILVFARWPVVWTEEPHKYFLYAQPAFVWLMIMTDVWNLTSSPAYISFAIFAHVAGFFTTTMVCHGEMAKDRPGTKHLTEFFLWMSVGGMVGGMFNALIAPVVFKYGTWEFPLAIFAAGLVRPKMFDVGLLDNWIASLFEGQSAQPAHKPGQKGKPAVAPVARAVTANESLVQTLDYGWPVVILLLTALMAFMFSDMLGNLGDYFFRPRENQRAEPSIILQMIIAFGIPLALAALCLARPLRIGLGIGAVLLVYQFHQAQQDSGSIHKDRSYFGAISVKRANRPFEWPKDSKDRQDFPYHTLTHGHINHGMNFRPPTKVDDRGKQNKDLSRLATTYYHREGPVGRVMEKFNWAKGLKNDENTYHADARLPASLAASVVADGFASLPLATLVTAWSEPPIATVGLGTGTMASYGRPFQHVHFYEIDNQIQRLSLPAPTSELIGGEWKNDNDKPGAEFLRPYNVLLRERTKASPNEIYFNYLEQAIERGCSVQVLMGDARLRMALPYQNHYKFPNVNGGGPDNFYHMMVVDAFSSDAIPAHLLTKQAFELYFRKLTEEGILCVHTSNRFVDLPKVVAAVASELGYSHELGHDVNDDHVRGHFTSEWVMVARKQEYLKHLRGDTAFLDKYAQALSRKERRDRYWTTADISRRYLWTDDYYNLLSVVRFGK